MGTKQVVGRVGNWDGEQRKCDDVMTPNDGSNVGRVSGVFHFRGSVHLLSHFGIDSIDRHEVEGTSSSNLNSVSHILIIFELSTEDPRRTQRFLAPILQRQAANAR
jgi:hypothetical protein